LAKINDQLRKRPGGLHWGHSSGLRRRPHKNHRYDGYRARGDRRVRRSLRAAGAAVPRARDAALEGRLVAASAARAIFCTQSNDFALGLPVIQALYGGDEGRRMVAMLYLLATISA
jgi:hypothetical protein